MVLKVKAQPAGPRLDLPTGAFSPLVSVGYDAITAQLGFR
jgi:hypothetical protein